MANVKLSQIASGGAFVVATDNVVTVRSGTTDVLTTLGTLATQNGTFSGTSSGTNTGDQTITLTGAVTGSGTGSFATTIATPGTLTVSSTNSTATAHTHAITSSSAPGAGASILATDASGIIGSTGTRLTKGWFTDLEVTNAPTSGGVAIPTISSTNTLTNKRVTRRFVATTQSATPTINTDNTDIASITGLAQAITSMTTNLTGTPVAGDYLMVQITDNGTGRALTFGASFAATTIALPTTTVASTLLRIGFQYNSISTKWECIAVA